jgi:hypothetical protein
VGWNHVGIGGRSGRDRMVVGFTTTSVISANIPVISWMSVLLVGETGVHRENHRLVASHWQTLSHNVVSSTPRHRQDSNSQFLWRLITRFTYDVWFNRDDSNYIILSGVHIVQKKLDLFHEYYYEFSMWLCRGYRASLKCRRSWVRFSVRSN